MASYKYKTRGTCATAIDFELEDGIVKNVVFTGGCNGNTKGIASLVDGMKAEDIISRLKNTKCGLKSTSCPDQLAIAIEQALAD